MLAKGVLGSHWLLLFETACRNAHPVKMIWSFVGHLNLFATTATFSRRKKLGCIEDQCPRLYQVFLSVLTVTFLRTKHILHMVLQCLFFTMECLKSSLWTIYASQSFFQPALGKGWLFSFIVSTHRFWLVLQSALRGVIRQFYTHCFCLFGSLHPSTEIITLISRVMEFALFS